ncbi:alanine--tRNA ligase [Candidatus Pacearchaeota archaeon CG10_big_fil_rev_8_21_14_0_10_34_12]|nr:MAG: alanine--tRNA ligase [Candidatus Pacearchaeota archaeon CG10_big_fil_rev_8_21_14_0_10_34_12]
MNRKELIKKYLQFFKEKNHAIIPSASLIPSNDPTVLFTTAGMHPLVPYLLGMKHPLGKRIADVQKCIRTGDIEDVGDTYHHTFFEMLGNWSLGDYFKKEAIEMSFEFLAKVLKIPKERLAVSVFAGNKDAPKDTESAKIWQSLGVPKERIAYLGKEDNWWGPAGNIGPCGPDTEMFYWKLNNKPAPKNFNPKDKNWVEIWNDVLMQYIKDEKGNYNEARQKNIDTGMGVERTVTVLNGLEDDYLSDSFKPIMEVIEKLSNKKYPKNEKERLAIKLKHDNYESYEKEVIIPMRIIADHIKASVMILSEKIVPGNTEQGYVLRRLLRRAIRYGKLLGMKNFTPRVAEPVFKIYDDYKELKENRKEILKNLEEEENRFNETLERGINLFNKISKDKKEISGKDMFLLFQSYGFPLELTQELAKENKIKINEKEFRKEFQKHQELSRTASQGRFKSGLADNSEKTTRLHTATHLLNEALRKVLGNEVKQRGSNITPERLRFDFSFNRKLTDEEVRNVENFVNKKISLGLEVKKEEMPLEKAISSGAQSEFGSKYPPKVSVYTIKDSKEKHGWFSKEICTGPHVQNTKEIGKFKILKEESSSAGVRRIKASVE